MYLCYNSDMSKPTNPYVLILKIGLFGFFAKEHELKPEIVHGQEKRVGYQW